MKRLLVVAAIAALAVTSVAGEAEARRGSRTQVVQTAPAVDINTLLLLGAMGGTGLTGSAALLPFLLAPQATTVIESGRGRGIRRSRGGVVTGPLPALSRRAR